MGKGNYQRTPLGLERIRLAHLKNGLLVREERCREQKQKIRDVEKLIKQLEIEAEEAVIVKGTE